VTGLIGRVNRNRYQVATPTATVGIRGTGGLIEILQGGATLVQGTSGIWFLANPAGTIDIPAGVAGLAPVDPKQPPKETVQIPTAGPSPLPALIEFVQGEERETDGENVIETSTTPVLMSGSGYALAAFFGDSGGEDSTEDLNANAIFNASGQMTDVSLPNLFEFYSLGSGGSHADFGTDGILAWGRWVGPVTGDTCGECSLNENYNGNQGFHYVVGMPTPSMPTIGTASYTLIGATRPTYVDGLNAPGTLSGSLSVDFGQLTVGVNLNVAMPDNSFNIGGSADISRSAPTFSGDSGLGLTVSGTDCGSGCTAFVSGFFSGALAERAGLGYHIGTGSSRDVIGAAAFTKQ
jgi:hypothetical protein